MQHPPVRPLDYATPTPPTGRIFWMRPTFLWCFICWFWIAVALVIMPRFEQIFKDFKVSLPLITQLGLMLCHLIARGGWTILLVAPACVPVFIPRSDRRPPAAWFFIVAGYAAMVLSLVFMLTAVFLPMFTLIGAVSGK
jgi:hypothetical protein